MTHVLFAMCLFYMSDIKKMKNREAQSSAHISYIPLNSRDIQCDIGIFSLHQAHHRLPTSG